MANEYYKELSQSGEALIKAISGLTQIAKMHLDNNALLVDAAKKFIILIKKSGLKEDDVSIAHSDGRFYFQGKKLHIRQENKRIVNRMLQYLEQRSIYSLHFKTDLNGVSGGQIFTFAQLIGQAGQHHEPSEWLKGQFEENDIKWVDINRRAVSQHSDPMSQADEIPQQDDLAVKRAQAGKHYSNVLGSVKEVSRKLSSDQNAGLRNIVRLVQKMVDLITEDDSLFTIFSTVRIYDDYTYVHSLNVAILSMCIGKQIGLDHVMLERLGLCGLFHDLGKVEISKQILNKRGRLDDDEYTEIKTHPIHSARLILKLKARRDRKVKILMAPFEHHMGYNRSGYPRIKNNSSGISLFGRILAIADVYDAITSPRIYRAQTLSPDRALGSMLEQSGTSFDPILLKVFINMLGVYPVGTLLKIDTGEMGIVIDRPKGKDRSRPIVQLIVGAKNKYEKGPIIDLAKQNPRTGTHHRNIVESMHPADMGFQATKFLL